MALTPEAVFRLHPAIRWVAYSLDGSVIFCQTRPGVKSYTADEDDRAFMEFGPLLLHGISERLSPHGEVGRLENIIISFESDSVLLTQVGEGYLALSVNRTEALTVFSVIEAEIKRLSTA